MSESSSQTRDKMEIITLALIVALTLGTSAFPAPQQDVSPMAERAVKLSLDQVNLQYGRDHLYRLTKASLKRVVSVGRNIQDLILRFSVRETDCLKSSRVDPLSCNFRRGFFVSHPSCYSRVRMSETSAQLIALRCSHGDSSSSSSESSEEVGRNTWHFNPMAPRGPTPPPAVDVPSLGGQDESQISRLDQVPQRGDVFTNHLL